MNPNKFSARHNGPDAQDVADMLEVVGASSVEELISQTIPANIRLANLPDLPDEVSEQALLKELRTIGARNRVYNTYIGLGYHDTITPGVILRNIFENPGWYTAYTPYQAEIAQGRLEALLNFQTLVTELSGMEIANASLLDEATAAAEAMAMLFAGRSREMTQRGVNKFFVSEDCLPQTLDVLKTRSEPIGIELHIGDHRNFVPDDSYYGMLLQYPCRDGRVEDYRELVSKAKDKGMQIAVAADIMSLVLLASPGSWGADVVFGSSQRFGVPLGYGGPHAAFFATKESYKRDMPGRIIGVSIDAQGKPALRMALQTREQHIKRDKATSNICTSQVLLAVLAGMYAVYHGPKGLKYIAGDIHRKAAVLADHLNQLGYTVKEKNFFDTLHIEVGADLEIIRQKALVALMNLRYNDDQSICISLDETTTPEDLLEIIQVFASTRHKDISTITATSLECELPVSFQESLIRTDEILTHPVFNTHHSETEMLRYMKSLENKDLALNHSMIPLGSCTMKLNATAEMMPLSWPEWSSIHPFVPTNQAVGYQQMLAELERHLCAITGFFAVSLQPNSGAQGEYAGLIVIREYLRDKGEGHRNIVLIPSSAHGTNPASAVMAGMKVVVVKCDEIGNIDLADLRSRAEEHSAKLAAIMVTYPSTHGVYEEGIKEITSIIHEHGGQVYMDGANMNAQVGLTNPANIGADVCHLNLHKTFAIPHGGGGPGMGPIGVGAHLAPYLPGHPVIATGGSKHSTAISAAPWGSASILLISYAYIRMMGREGLAEATRMAILNANYIKARLEDHYPVLYKGSKGRVAHEMILDCRPFKAAGIDVVDIAKRLIDYGFHAPTISFPVPGTIMVEPTESESKVELDRFCEAMIAIREEIREVETGIADKEDNVLHNAPHTAEEVTSDTWEHKYSRQKAAYPVSWIRANKFWPVVGRVDNAFGDRNLVCSCPPIEEYAEVNQE